MNRGLYNKIFLIIFTIYSIVFLFFTQKNPGLFPFSVNYLLFGLFFLITVLQTSVLFKIKKQMIIFTLILLLFTLSIIYSPDKIIAIKQYVSFFLLYYLLLFIYLYFDKKYTKYFLFLIFLLSAMYVVYSIATYNQYLNYLGKYDGLTGNSHNTSLILSVFAITNSTLLFFCKQTIVRLVLVLIIFTLQVLLYLAWARIGFFVEIIYFLLIAPYLWINTNRKLMKYIIVFLVMVTIIFLVNNISQFTLLNEYITYSVERGSTNRDTINTTLFNWQVSHNWSFLILGLGIGSLDYYQNISEFYNGDASNIIGIIFNNGIVGLFLYFLLFLQLIYILIKNISNKYSYLFASMGLSIFLIPSEVSWLNFNYFATIFMYICIALSIKYNRYKELSI